MKKNFVIGVEGEVGAGKTSMCKELIKIIPNTIFIDGGLIFRGIILAIKKYKAINYNDSNTYKHNNDDDKGNKKVERTPNNFETNKSADENVPALDAFEIMKKLNVEFKIVNMQTVIFIDGKEMNQEEIETMENSMDVSKVASKSDNNALFKFANNIIKEYNTKYNVIVSARDLVEIYPEMDLHLFVTADIEERIKRRYNQYKGKYSIEEIKNIILKRDELHNKAGFNKKCNKTVTLDLTDCKNANESAKKALNVIKEHSLIWTINYNL